MLTKYRKKETQITTKKPYSLLLFLSIALGIGICLGIFGTVQPVFAQDKDKPKTEKQDDDDDDDEYETAEMQKKLAKEAKISQKDAEKIALKRVPGKVVEREIDKEKGKIVWEFEIKTKEGKVFDVSVDAETGDIVEVEDESDEKDDDDGTTSSKKKNIFNKTASGVKTTTAKVFRKITGN